MTAHGIDRWFRSQHGIITRQQARLEGLTDSQIKTRLARGEWLRVAPGVFRLAAVLATWRSQLLVACLAADGVASHRSAAVLHGIDGFRPGRPEVTVPLERVRAVSATLHRTTQWWVDQHTRIDSIPCTDLERTIVDVAAVVGRHSLDDTIDAVLRSTPLELPDLFDIVVRHARRGRDGGGRLRAALGRRRADARVPLSVWSRKVGRLLTAGGLPEPSYEHRVVDEAGSVVQVDLAYPARRVAIELDSISWHFTRAAFQRDRERWNTIALAGWTLLVFTWEDYSRRPEALIATVRAAAVPET